MKNLNSVISIVIILSSICNHANGQNKIEMDKTVLDSLPMRTMMLQSTSSIEIPKHKEDVWVPEMKLMNMYGNYPVDLSNGLVNISIPLYEIKTAQLSLPINIKFHASGLKANEQEGRLGLRWFLDANYSVNRSIKGYPDDGYYDTGTSLSFDNRVNSPGYTPDLSTLYGTAFSFGLATRYAITENMLRLLSNYEGPASVFMDTEYDIFHYQLPSGKSGKFILKDSAGIKIPCPLPYEAIKIEIDKGHTFGQFVITDENGISYSYGVTLHLPVNTMVITGSSDDLAPTAWPLTAIISPDKKDSIFFDYKYVFYRNKNKLSAASVINDNFDPIYGSGSHVGLYPPPLYRFLCETYWGATADHIEQGNVKETPIVLSSIIFKGGKIAFNYSTVFDNYYLTSMDVFNSNSILTKKINFVYKKEGVFVLLDKLSSTGTEVSQAKENYKFDYYNSYLYPNSDEVQADWWGYFSSGRYNVIYENNIYSVRPNFWGPITGVIDYLTIGNPQCSDKNSNLNSMLTGMIQSIHYPTGGKTNYEYDSNYFFNQRSQQIEACGGLRIKSVENVSADGKSEMKTYKYNPENNGGGYMPYHFYPPFSINNAKKNYVTEISTEVLFRWNWDDHQARTSDQCWVSGTDAGFFYANYITEGGIFSTRTYSNILPSQFNEFHSNIVYYNKVVEYHGTESSNTGYTEYSYIYDCPSTTNYIHDESAFDYMYTNNSRQFTHVLPPRCGESSHLSKKAIYNQSKQLQEETIYDYNQFIKGELFDMPIKRFRYFMLGGDPDFIRFPRDKEVIAIDNSPLSVFAYANQEYVLGATRLLKETIHKYSPQGQITTVKDIAYDPVYLLPIKETTNTSLNNETVSVTYKYPFHYNQFPYTGMKQSNILSPVIEKSMYKNDILMGKGITNYHNWAPQIYAPLSFQYQKQGNPIETRVEYQYNTQGQLKAASKDDTQKVVYIRNGLSQPLAVIEQVTYNDVESKLGAAFVNALAKKVLITDSDMNTLVGLRNSLPNALVTIYKYKPLFGISEIIDPRGISTYYEYDGLGRLKEIYRIVNSQKEAFESYDYNYKNQ